LIPSIIAISAVFVIQPPPIFQKTNALGYCSELVESIGVFVVFTYFNATYLLDIKNLAELLVAFFMPGYSATSLSSRS